MTIEPSENATDTAAPPVRPTLKQRLTVRMVRGTIFLMAGVVLLIVVANVITFGDLPDCDHKVTRDHMSDYLGSNNVRAASYNQIKTLSKSKDENTCTASLALRGGGNYEVDWKILHNGWGSKIEVTRAERKP